MWCWTFTASPSLRELDSFDDFERWIDLNMRYLRRIGYLRRTPTYHALAGQLAKSDDATRETLAAGYWQWIELLEEAIQRMKDRGVLVADADPRKLALVMVSAHQGGATLAFTYRAEWPHADATRFAVNYLRMFATDPAERVPRPPRRPRGRRLKPNGEPRERRRHTTFHPQRTGDPGAHRRRRRQADVRARRCQHQYRRGTQHGRG